VSTGGRAELAEKARAILGDRVAATFDRAVPHVPRETAMGAATEASRADADCLVALGGGSAIGVAKAVALETALPIVAVPTTYGGSEMTPIWGLTLDGRKETGRNPVVQPRVVIYDPDLALGLPARTTACSGLNALAHCIEALYAVNANALVSATAEEGIRLLSSVLPPVVAAPTDRQRRKEMLTGAWLAGFALGTVQMGLHHKLCHTLGGSFDLPHAETHAVLLPYTAAHNRDAAPRAMRAAAAVLGVEDTPTELLSIAKTIEAPLSLREIGMRESDLDKAADLAVEREYPNPRPVTREGIMELLRAAHAGDEGYIRT